MALRRPAVARRRAPSSSSRSSGGGGARPRAGGGPPPPPAPPGPGAPEPQRLQRPRKVLEDHVVQVPGDPATLLPLGAGLDLLAAQAFPLLFRLLTLGDVLVGDHHPRRIGAGKTRHPPHKPATLGGRMAGVLELEGLPPTGEHRPHTPRERGGVRAVPARGRVADPQVVGVLGDLIRGGPVGLGEPAPGPVGGDDRARFVEDGHVRGEAVYGGLGEGRGAARRIPNSVVGVADQDTGNQAAGVGDLARKNIYADEGAVLTSQPRLPGGALPRFEDPVRPGVADEEVVERRPAQPAGPVEEDALQGRVGVQDVPCIRVVDQNPDGVVLHHRAVDLLAQHRPRPSETSSVWRTVSRCPATPVHSTTPASAPIKAATGTPAGPGTAAGQGRLPGRTGVA